MAKTIALDWHEFMHNGRVVEKEPRVNMMMKLASVAPSIIIPTSVSSTPTLAGHTAAGGAWQNIFSTVIMISDWLCVGTIVFAGGIWMFGDRTKALERLIGAAIGFLIIIHSVDIVNWLKSF